METNFLNGVGKKVRKAYLNGEISEEKVQSLYLRNKKEAEAFSCFGYRQQEIAKMAMETHNPLLRQKLETHLLEMREKSQISKSQNDLNLQKLEAFKANGCGVGLRKVLKRMKNEARYSMEAKLVLLLLETEYANLSAKQHCGRLKEKIYERKSILLYQMADYLEELGWKYGINDETGKNASYLVYVYLPNGVQLTWHCNEYDIYEYFPTIEAQWDGQVCMTMEKILTYIGERYYRLQAAA